MPKGKGHRRGCSCGFCKALFVAAGGAGWKNGGAKRKKKGGKR